LKRTKLANNNTFEAIRNGSDRKSKKERWLEPTNFAFKFLIFLY
jgi:hypothetical protein